MKNFILILSAPAAVSASAATDAVSPHAMKTALLFLCVITAALLLFSVFFTYMTLHNKKARRSFAQLLVLGLLYITTIIACLCTVFSFGRYRQITSPVETETIPLVTDTYPAGEDENMEVLSPAFLTNT